MNVMVIGSGTMGSGIAQVLAENNHKVVLRDLNQDSLDRGIKLIEKNLSRNVQKGKLSEEEKQVILNNIVLSTDIDLAKNCDLVIEAIVEDMNIKKELFKQLDKICSEETILATNTSSLSITEISVATTRPDKVIGMHFFNPVPVMKLVEIIDGQLTSKETHDKIEQLTKKINKTPVAVSEAPGFVVNRILIPMINEAVGILADKVASVEDIDNAMKLGANHPIGPLALADLIGNDVCLAIMEVLYDEFKDSKYRPHPYLRKMVRAGLLGRKSKQGFYDYK